MQTGQKISKLRTLANLTQEQLAEKLFVSRELVSKWETDSRLPDKHTVIKLAEIFGVAPEEIFSRDEGLLSELSDCIPDECFDNQRLTEYINGFLALLNERDRSVFIRRYYFGEEISVISCGYGIKENHARTILMRARKKMKKYFKGV
ncbi:MAG: helix-turn-helix domain-containing protein [Clostridia bacterium]|nr:helix-turn-helix domain-containing protein [Clostridia bacterium]